MLKIIGVLILIIVIIYIAMIIDTNSLMTQVRDVFSGKVDRSQTIGKPINRYNYRGFFSDITKTDLKLIRVFTLHNFKDGYIWAWYTYEGKDNNDEVLTGSSNIFSKWKIHKENGKWDIVEIFEDP
jgi:hypothetical protein